jgi:uncharacterized protein
MAALAIWSTAIEPGLLRTRTVVLESAHWPAQRPDLKVVFIADLHIGSPHITLAKLDEIVAEANAAKPDIVLLGGDYVAHVLGGRAVPPEDIAARLGKLRARYAVVSVLGNHDHWDRQGGRMRQALEAVRILVLENEARRVETDAGLLWIVGVGTDLGGFASTAAAFRNVPLGTAEPVLVLAHDPGIFYEIPRGVAAIFTGHTHGGQVRLPLVGALINASRAPLSHSYGVIREHGKVMFVTAGVGTSVLPIRFNCPPEIAVLTIRAEPLKR